MNETFQFLMLGLGAGAVYSALALGLVLTYRGSGLINFSHGATAMYLAYAYTELRAKGDLVLPWIGVKSRFGFGNKLDFWPAMLITLLLSAALGLALHTLVFRPLRNAPPLAKTVASVGVLIAMQGMAVLKFGTDSRTIPSVLPSEPARFWGITIGQDRLYLAALVILAALALAVVFRFTTFGLATRAASENEKGATLLGYSPQRLAAINWILATMLAGLAGVLVGSITSLDPTTYTLLVVPALSAALVARFTSFTIATAAALVLGMLQSEILNLQSTYSWWPTGTRDALPFLVIVIATVVIGKRLPTRGSIIEGRMPTALRGRHPAIVGLASVVVGFVLLFALDGSYRGPFIASLNAAVICLSIVVLTGFVGQISLAQMAYAGAAGFILSKLAVNLGLPFPIAPLLAGVLAAALGLVVGLPSLRVRGINLAVVSLGLSVAVVEMWFKNPKWTGGYNGSPIPEPSIFGIHIGANNATSLGVVSLIALTLLAFGLSALRRSATGRQMLAVRANERAAAAAGINPATIKLIAFALSGFIAGIGGCLIGYQQTTLSFSTFDVMVSLTLLTLVYLGGVASVSGAIIAGALASGGIVFYALDQAFGFGKYQQVVSGIAVIVVAIMFSRGIAGAIPALGNQLRSRLSPAAPAPPIPATPSIESTGIQSTKPAAIARTEHGNGSPTPNLLEAVDITVRYGGVCAVDGVSLRVAGGTIVGLIGPNGAGKTSLIDALAGYTRCSGQVSLRGKPLGQLEPHQRARLGLTRTFQSLELFEDLTVEENLQVGAERQPWWAVFRDLIGAGLRRKTAAGTDPLDAVGLAAAANRMPTELSHGQRKLISVARALATKPQVVLLDEPAAGLDSSESVALGQTLRALLDHGLTALLVDHDMGLVLSVCDYIYVLDFGKIIAEGVPAQIRQNPRVLEAYLGGAEPTPQEQTDHTGAHV